MPTKSPEAKSTPRDARQLLLLPLKVMHDWFINIVCSRQVPPRRVNRSTPAIVSAFSETSSPL
jgi:hypothetical protein